MWSIKPIPNEPGYYTIRQNGLYLSIYGELLSSKDDQLCAFAITRGSFASRQSIFGQLVYTGLETISSVQITNLVNSNSANPISLTNPNTKNNQVFNLVPVAKTGYFYIADILNEQFVLAANDYYVSVQFKPNDTSLNPKQIWTTKPGNRAENKQLILENGFDNQMCLNANLTSNTIGIENCTTNNTNFCFDIRRNYISYSTCQTRLDEWECKEWLKNIPFVGAALYRASCHLKSSGRWYCQDALNEAAYYVESPEFKVEGDNGAVHNQKCTQNPDIANPLNNWFLDRQDKDSVQSAYMGAIERTENALRGYSIFNAGLQRYLCPSGSRVVLASNPCSWTLHTLNNHGELDIPGGTHPGYMFQAATGQWMTGDPDMNGDGTILGTWSDTWGRFWKLRIRGYNVFHFVYGWGNGDTKCLTPVTSTNHAFKKCDNSNTNQFWYLEKI